MHQLDPWTSISDLYEVDQASQDLVVGGAFFLLNIQHNIPLPPDEPPQPHTTFFLFLFLLRDGTSDSLLVACMPDS